MDRGRQALLLIGFQPVGMWGMRGETCITTCNWQHLPVGLPSLLSAIPIPLTAPLSSPDPLTWSCLLVASVSRSGPPAGPRPAGWRRPAGSPGKRCAWCCRRLPEKRKRVWSEVTGMGKWRRYRGHWLKVVGEGFFFTPTSLVSARVSLVLRSSSLASNSSWEELRPSFS